MVIKPMLNKLSRYSKTFGILSMDRNDCIQRCDSKGEITLPIAHYALISSNIKPKIVIYGLGSCIALILYDSQNKVFAMSHILLPHSDKNTFPKFPHKFADSSVKDLMENMILNGAEKSNIKAVIVGGSKIFQNQINNVGTENIKAVKRELERLKIRISNEDVGGKRGRIIIYDTEENTVYSKTTGEENFRKIL